MLSHDNFIQANTLIARATKDITLAKGLIDQSIVLDVLPNTAPDAQSTYWPALSTALGNVLTSLATASADVYFYPDQIHG